MSIQLEQGREREISLELSKVADELRRAFAIHGDFASEHEGYAVVLEELDEFWDEVKLKEPKRNKVKLLQESKQVAAMAVKLMMFIEKKYGGKKNE